MPISEAKPVRRCWPCRRNDGPMNGRRTTSSRRRSARASISALSCEVTRTALFGRSPVRLSICAVNGHTSGWGERIVTGWPDLVGIVLGGRKDMTASLRPEDRVQQWDGGLRRRRPSPLPRRFPAANRLDTPFGRFCRNCGGAIIVSSSRRVMVGREQSNGNRPSHVTPPACDGRQRVIDYLLGKAGNDRTETRHGRAVRSLSRLAWYAV